MANLQKWLFYFDRWNNHELSARLDERLFERAEEKINEVQVASGLSWIEVSVGSFFVTTSAYVL